LATPQHNARFDARTGVDDGVRSHGATGTPIAKFYTNARTVERFIPLATNPSQPPGRVHNQ